MLRINQNRSAASAKSYYSRAEYYGEGQEKAGRWGGKLARMLGLEGQVRESDFHALCDNLDPRTGQQLTARHDQQRTAGYDFSWHLPKGVSLAYAIGGDARIEEVLDRCVSETMAEMECEVKTRVRVGGRHENRTTGNLAWGQFTHISTRPNEKGEVDPHLHIHAFVINATWDQKEQKFKAGQFRDLKRDAPYFEARFHARLARAMREELGYSIERDGRFWDIAGIPKDVKNVYSRRTLEIEQLAEQLGIQSADEKAELGAKTRNSKSNHESFKTLQQSWRERLKPEELQLFDQLTDSANGGTVNGARTTEEAVRLALLHCFERESVVPERKVLEEALRMGVGTIDVRDVTAEAYRQGLVSRDIDGMRLATVPEVLADEEAVLAFAREGRNAVEPLNSQWKSESSWLSTEQTAAIDQLTHSRDRMQLILGGAGTGKTTLMQQAVAAIEAGGHQVFTFAPSAEASRKVLRDEGFSSATTVAELLVNTELQNDVRNSVIWIDEASLLGTRQLKQVIDLAERQDARLILSGDWKRQHGSVQRGGVLGVIDRYAGIAPIQINTIRRQQGQYREAIGSMAEGNIQKGFDQIDRLGWVHELNDDIRDHRIATDFVDLVEKGDSALVVSPTHREAAHIASAIRGVLRQREMITGEDHTVMTLQPIHLTEGERSDPAFLRDGDVLVFHQNGKGVRKGQRLTVNGPVPRSITSQAQRFTVYRSAPMQLAAGDVIRINAGGKTKDGKHRLNTGSVHHVAEITANGDIRLRNGWLIDSQFGHFTQGFVTTSHASQGRTVDHVLIAESAESFAAGSREQMYVSASRGRKSAQIYTNSKLELRAVIAESSAKTTAIEVFGTMKHHARHLTQLQAAVSEIPQKQLQPELSHER